MTKACGFIDLGPVTREGDAGQGDRVGHFGLTIPYPTSRSGRMRSD
jgi:hypothetical protein